MPVREVRKFPAWELRGWAQYLSRIPPPDDRSEAQLAQLAAMYSNSHRAQGSAPLKLADFLLFKDPWAQEAEIASGEHDQKVFKSLVEAIGAGA